VKALIAPLCAVGVLASCGGTPAPVEPTIPVEKKPEPPSVVEWSKLVGPIKTIDVTTPDATLVAKVKDALAGVVAKPLDRRELRNALTGVIALPGVSEASVHATQLADGIQLIVDVTPQPTLHALAAREVGGQDLVLPGQLTSAIGLPVDPSLLDALGVQLRDLYLSKGFTEASVEWKQTAAAKGAVDVAVEVTPGKASVITAVEFKGNAHIKKADLVKAVGEGFAPNSPWNADIVTRGSLLVTSYYYDHGYVNVAVEEPTPPGMPGPVVYSITEGDQFRVGKLELTGESAANTKKYLGLIGVKQGDVFNRSVIADGLTKLNEALKANGETDAYVRPITNVDTKKKVIDLKFEVSKT
jgi:outer membrane protein assembly factor BamA